MRTQAAALLVLLLAGCGVCELQAGQPLAKKALQFLQDYAPPRHVASLACTQCPNQAADEAAVCRDQELPEEYLQLNIDYAMKPLHLFPWAAAVPECLWLNAVLPHAM